MLLCSIPYVSLLFVLRRLYSSDGFVALPCDGMPAGGILYYVVLLGRVDCLWYELSVFKD